ncbi:hypothetical protein Poli38472_013232 [Pythium oligandrum]|uniref:Tim44-like domain-containing protein n=1 Tax=Pythium oligandrum TaxID=41045 RepID=A0A8K1C2N0_PYTOL|nr:hypothetical protein Poli38472_013232 [Pythium oligandrum]|eukprot:TMW55341.1 hypothetical protein Poli38472_013232 [Pythium oligandrum]
MRIGSQRGIAGALRRRTLSGQRSQQSRLFSQTSGNKPSIYDGWTGISAFANRVKDRVALFERYHEHNVFPPTMNTLSQYLLFARLQLPTATEIDPVEFLGGAQHAVDLALHTMFSQEVANYAFGEISESPATATLQRIMSPMCFDMFFQGLKGMKGTMRTMEMKNLDIKSVHLASVSWDKLTVAEMKQQERDDMASTHELIRARLLVSSLTKDPTQEAVVDAANKHLDGLTDIDSIVIEESDHHTMVERMRLDVITESTETVSTSTEENGEQTITRDTAALWRFESVVTRPEDVDWRILTFMERAPGLRL